jgi:hypothetical protein
MAITPWKLKERDTSGMVTPLGVRLIFENPEDPEKLFTVVLVHRYDAGVRVMAHEGREAHFYPEEPENKVYAYIDFMPLGCLPTVLDELQRIRVILDERPAG